MTDPGPAVIHLTHWKAGSTWIRRILRRLTGERYVPHSPDDTPFPTPLGAGAVYSAYATKEQFEAASIPDPWRRFIVVRDLRDTLVSAYFSFRDTHVENKFIEPVTLRLRELDKEAGMIYLMDEFLPRCARIQASWEGEGERIVRYEDLLAGDLEILEDVLLNHCELDVPRARFERVVKQNRFRHVTGRRRGEEAEHHLRKGVAGDWRNHFSDRVAEEFDARFDQRGY